MRPEQGASNLQNNNEGVTPHPFAAPQCLAMIPVPSGVRVWLAVGRTDMRRGMNGLALQVQETLGRDPFAGDLFVFRGARGDLIKILWHDGLGLSLYAKRLERGRFVWPSAANGTVSISAAQLAYMLDGIDWRNPVHTFRPERAG
jgi:transposase